MSEPFLPIERPERPLIGGPATPIDGGVFKREGQPGIVVDKKYFEGRSWFDGKSGDDILVASINRDMLRMVSYVADKQMPINMEHFDYVMKNKAVGYNRVALSEFVSQKDENGVEIGGGSPDTKALYTAFLLERKVKSDPDRKVWIEKSADDGHAIVVYEGKSGNYKLDPTNGEKDFVKQA
jgi:hypothetical protein